MRRDFQKLYRLLTPRERKLAVGVVTVMVLAAGLQVLATASIYPFLAAVSSRSALETGRLGLLYHALGFTNHREFFVFAGLSVLVLILLSNASLAFAQWAQLRFQWEVNHNLSVRLLTSYLDQQYAFFLLENTAELHRNILAEAREVSDGLVNPALTMLSNGTLAVAMLVVLVALDPTATLLVLAITGTGYSAAYLFIRRHLEDLGVRYLEANRQRFKTTEEAFGGIKDVKVLGREAYFLAAFKPASRAFSRVLAARGVFTRLPKYAIEALAMGSLLAVLVLLLITGRPVSTIVPLMGTFAFAGYRMMPAFRDILSAMASFRFTDEVFAVIEEAVRAGDGPMAAGHEILGESARLPFVHKVELEAVSYEYPRTTSPALKDISISISRNSAVAFVGRTGAGKTTLVDVLLGLLTPTMGRLLVDDVEVTRDRMRRWQANLGYVPQDIYMADTSIARNIAYGIPEDEIDEVAVVRAARIANVHDFVVDTLPAGYDTVIGERGVRLSGGQRQRIGIARALYHDPLVLVLDEATSEIDGATEASITQAIRDLRGQKTLIVVAHRLNTIRHCDVIYVVEDGEIAEWGTYDELSLKSLRFRQLSGERAMDSAASS